MIPTFPVISSTLSADDLGLFINQKYGLDNCVCKLFRTGINHTYLITSGTAKYAFRIYSYNWRIKSEIQDELDLLIRLKKNNISVSFPITDSGGNLIQTINAPEGVRYAVLFSFADGGKIRVIDNETCFKIGALMAKMHNITINQSNSRIKYSAETLLTLPYKRTLTFFDKALPEMQFLKKQVEDISNYFNNVATNTIPCGIIHLDIWYDNMAITDDNKITVFDFDFCGNGWLIFDVAYFCKQLFHIESNKDNYEEKVKSFLNGYQSIRDLSNEELDLIPKAAVAVFIFYLGVQCQRLDWSNVFLSENYLKMLYIPRIKSWVDYYETKCII